MSIQESNKTHIKYYLAMSGGTLGELAKFTHQREKMEFNNLDKDIRFYNEVPAGSGYFYHNKLLFSAVHIKPLMKKYGSIKTALQLDDKVDVFIDSGGYSLATGAVAMDKWTNADAFKLSIENGHIYPILDLPVTPDADFDKHLRISKESAQYYHDRKPDKGEIILNVAHGRHLGEVKRWVDDISKVKLDGWALGSSHRGNPKEILKGMFYMLSCGVLTESQAFHIFGVSSASMIIYFAAVKHAIKRNKKLKFKFDITFDSSYPLRTAAFGNFYMYRKFDGFTGIKFTNTIDWSGLQKDDFEEGFFCQCPVCAQIKNIGGILNAERSNELGMWISLHNVNTMLQYKKEIECLVEMCMDVPGLAPHIFPAQIARNIEVIGEAFDNITIGEEIITRKFIASDIAESGSLEEFFA
jgi:hypothetical protein